VVRKSFQKRVLDRKIEVTCENAEHRKQQECRAPQASAEHHKQVPSIKSKCLALQAQEQEAMLGTWLRCSALACRVTIELT